MRAEKVCMPASLTRKQICVERVVCFDSVYTEQCIAVVLVKCCDISRMDRQRTVLQRFIGNRLDDKFLPVDLDVCFLVQIICFVW